MQFAVGIKIYRGGSADWAGSPRSALWSGAHSVLLGPGASYSGGDRHDPLDLLEPRLSSDLAHRSRRRRQPIFRSSSATSTQARVRKSM